MNLQDIKNWFEPDTLTGLEIQLGAEGISGLHACTLQLKRNKVQLLVQKTGLRNLAHFKQHFKPGPVVACLKGKGILSKKTEGEVRADQQLIQRLWPNISYNDFYYQLSQSTVALIRKSDALQWTGQLAEMGFQVTGLSLGDGQEAILTEADRKRIDPELLSAYSAALNGLLGTAPDLVNDELTAGTRAEMLARFRIQRTGLVAAAICLLVLLVNFGLFQYYSEAAGKLASEKESAAARVGKYQGMEQDIRDKQALVRRVGWTGGYPKSFLTDQLMACKPPGILLTGLHFGLLKTNSGQEALQPGVVTISGTCEQAALLNNWLSVIRTMDWARSCSVADYGINQDTGKGKFSMEIELADYEG